MYVKFDFMYKSNSEVLELACAARESLAFRGLVQSLSVVLSSPMNLTRHKVSSFLIVHQSRELLPKVERVALKAFKADQAIVIVPADKGCSTVVLNRID
ncbi:unnamed protein product [Dibothriocephalus latus]|uniref:Uncharacterized protein n=1 Tax=Dibothriocephalus latus TaxID=60516 RepID=A0A3P6T6J5_DIBLA|nr:unnamed protein product [Dibothriocephalus latus]